VLLPEKKSLLLLSHITTTDMYIDMFLEKKKTRQHNKKYVLRLKKRIPNSENQGAREKKNSRIM